MTQSAPVLGIRKRRLALATGAALFLALSGAVWWWSAKAADLQTMERTVRRRFPDVRQLSTQDLSSWLKSNRPKPVLLDVREPAEFSISHLPGARHVEPDTPVEKLASTLPKDTPIVTYCSVGWRSSDFAQKLQKAGYKNVQNLEGSIFRWANEDRPLTRNGQATDKVHPYSGYWGRLVRPEKRADISKPKR